MELYLLYVKKPDCEPCTTLRPKADEAALLAGLKMAVRTLDEVGPEMVSEWRIRSVPTLLLLDSEGHRLAGWTGKFISPSSVAYAAERLRKEPTV